MRQTAKKAACKLRSAITLSQSPYHTVVGSLCSSRVSMRSVHTEGSTHPQRAGMSPACLGEVGPTTAAGRVVSSFVMFFALPLSCVPWLHARYALPRYYGRSDSCRAGSSGRCGHERRSVPRQVSLLTSLTLPAILSPTTRRRCRGFSFAHGFFQHAFIVLLACSASNGEALPSTESMGYRADFAQRSQARPTAWPNRVHVDHLR